MLIKCIEGRECKLNKQQNLLEWIKNKGIVTSWEVKKFGFSIYLLDCDRRCREWARAGILERLSDPQKKMMGIKRHFAAWKYIKTEKPLNAVVGIEKVE